MPGSIDRVCHPHELSAATRVPLTACSTGCECRVCQPKPDSGPAIATVPEAAAWIGVPLGTAMSIPGWHASQGRTSQNCEVIGPFTGQMNPDELSPCTGPAGSAGAAEASWAAWS